MLTDTGTSSCAQIRSFPFDAVEWTGGLYKERFDTCALVTVPHLQDMFEREEISHVLENFRIAAGEAQGRFRGTAFGDGDFYKWMEAAVCTGVRTGNAALLEQLEGYIELIGRAQQEDGYISTKQIIGERDQSAARLGDINDFEVYNFGHLFTSACIYKRVTGKDSFLGIAEKAARYLKRLYEAADKNGNVQTAVCPSHYMGLAELYRTTGDIQYLHLLEKAIALRDSVSNGLDDNQDRLPLEEHEKIIGHAVRANYLYAGVADLCLERENEKLKNMLHKVWDSLVNTKLYLTGGCGALYNGASPYGNFFRHQLVHQAYGYEYQLPNVTAYNETCASIGGVYWAWRMFCLEKKAVYADILERMMLNGNLAGISMNGRQFFYENMLRRAGKLPYDLVWGQERSEYILSYCCPPNLARLIAQTSEYAYAEGEEGIYTILYGASRARISLKSGRAFTLLQETEYPYDGRIKFLFQDTGEDDKEQTGTTLFLRIPSWVRKGTVEYGTASQTVLTKLTRKDAGSYLAVQIEQLRDAVISLDLGMEARLTCAHTLAEETANQVAVERGPLVYCMEGMDTAAETIDDILIPSDIRLEPEMCSIDGREVTALTGTFLLRRTQAQREEEDYDRQALYQDYINRGYDKLQARMIPYFAWSNRGLDEMRIWMPVADICIHAEA